MQGWILTTGSDGCPALQEKQPRWTQRRGRSALGRQQSGKMVGVAGFKPTTPIPFRRGLGLYPALNPCGRHQRGLACRADARQRGLSDMAVRKAIASGRIAPSDRAPLWLSDWPVGILRPVVKTVANCALVDGTALLWCRVMERRTIRHDRFCKSGASKPFSCRLQCGSLIRPSIHGHAIEVPPRMSDASHRLDVRGECLVVTALLHEISTTRFLFICSVASYQR